MASGEPTRHRLSRSADRQLKLNGTLLAIALTQIRTTGNMDYLTKIAEQKTPRRLGAASNGVWQIRGANFGSIAAGRITHCCANGALRTGYCYAMPVPRLHQLLVVHHTTSPALEELLQSVLDGAGADGIKGVNTVVRHALAASVLDVLQSDGFLLGTPANIGYMSGALKYFFDQIYYPCLNARPNAPYGLYVHGNSDVIGATRAVESITKAMGWRPACDVVTVIGAPTAADRQACWELGATLAASLMDP